MEDNKDDNTHCAKNSQTINVESEGKNKQPAKKIGSTLQYQITRLDNAKNKKKEDSNAFSNSYLRKSSSLQETINNLNNAKNKKKEDANYSGAYSKKVNDMLKTKYGSEDYGRPPPGSLTEMRGVKAHSHVSKEVLELCEVINDSGEVIEDDVVIIFFGELFEIYTRINNKLVGLLIRARKHNFIDFEGECLFQRRDDHVPIFLIKPINEIRRLFK